MRTADVEPQLRVTEEQFGTLLDALPLHAPGFPVTWEEFVDPHRWMLVPDPDCVGYKAEFVVTRNDILTVKLNIWFAADLRYGECAMPHSHPWAFTAHLLSGGYAEERYTLGGTDSTPAVHTAGGMNHIGLDTYHEVTDVAAPGDTLSLMVCGPRVQDDWGYIDMHTGRKMPVRRDTSFLDRAAELNPRRFTA